MSIGAKRRVHGQTSHSQRASVPAARTNGATAACGNVLRAQRQTYSKALLPVSAGRWNSCPSAGSVISSEYFFASARSYSMSASRSASSIYLISALAEHSLSRGVSPFFDSMLPKEQVVPSMAAA